MKTDYTIDQLVKCVKREIKLRKQVYPGQIERKRMTTEVAEREIGCMETILEKLQSEEVAGRLL